MGKRVMVSKVLVDLLEEVANEIMQQEDGVHARDWLDENRISVTSRKKGGIIELETDHDWKVAFAVWYLASPALAKKLPRVRL